MLINSITTKITDPHFQTQLISLNPDDLCKSSKSKVSYIIYIDCQKYYAYILMVISHSLTGSLVFEGRGYTFCLYGYIHTYL